MALTSPILDDRTYEQLRDELVARIPVVAPQWTDHNESDPGIALLELFAFLGESLLYRFNQIPDTTRIAFLRLLGVRPRPARSASVLLAASTERPTGVQVLRGTAASAGDVTFETTSEVYVWPLEARAVGKVATVGKVTRGEQERRDHALARLKLRPNTAARFYDTVEVPADPLAAAAVPLDVSGTVDEALWVALLATENTDPQQLTGRTVFVGVAFDEEVERPFDLEQLRSTTQTPRYRSDGLDADEPAMLWRLWNGPLAPGSNRPRFTVLEVVGDTTGGMVHTGVVALTLPALPSLRGAGSSGDIDSPPPLDDEDVAARVLGWLQVRRPAGENDAIHKVMWVVVNAVQADEGRTAAAELLGTGTGDDDQRFALTRRPVLEGTVQLEVEEADGWRPWREVDPAELRRVSRDDPDQDRRFTVDLAAGEVRFAGPRAPQLGQRIRVSSYRHGMGAAGNVPAGAVTAISRVADVRVTNPLPATGGADPASLADALDAIPAEVHRRERAVVADDFRDLAEQVPGVARAHTLPLLHPDRPDDDAAGVVSVVVFPREDRRTPEAPLPDRDLLRRVARHLDARRLVTTELYVLPPTYRKVIVSVGVQVREGYQVDAIRRWVELILRQFLAPLPPFGPDGGGWPLGRAVRRAELEAVAVQVEGVEHLVDDLLLAEPGAPSTQLVQLDRWEVPQLTAITVVGGPPFPLGQPVTPAPSDGPVLVPLPLDVC